MSEKIVVTCEIRSMLIMKDTLAKLDINYKELNEHQIQVERRYYPIIINSDTGEISCDSDNKKEVEKISQEYMVSFFKDKAIKEGNKYEEHRKVNGEVELTIIRS